MLQRVKIAPGKDGDYAKAYDQEIWRLSARGVLSARLTEMDNNKVPLKRIFVMGCGRSGTWLLTGIMSTFENVSVLADEVEVENFGLISTTLPTLVLKRHYQSFAFIESIPAQIGIAYIVRHPFDVLTSHHPDYSLRFHIAPHRWLGEMLALQYLVETKRRDTMIIRYEDLVCNPNAVQKGLAETFRLKPTVTGEDFMTTFKPTEKALVAMHGLRKIDQKSIGRYKNEPEGIKRLKEIRPRLGRVLDWVSEEFSYDVTL
jgi:hypothetical protein